MVIWSGIILVLLFFFWEEIKYPVKNYFDSKNSNKNAFLAAERMARVKALSDNAKDIESFIKDNVSVLSEDSMSILVARLETIKSDQIISGDSLKSKIDLLEEPVELSGKRARSSK